MSTLVVATRVDEGIYCRHCNQLLNGKAQYNSHVVSKKHRNNTKMLRELDEGNVFCRHCNFWLNGKAQYEDHMVSKKHRKRIQKLEGLQAKLRLSSAEPQQSNL